MKRSRHLICGYANWRISVHCESFSGRLPFPSPGRNTESCDFGNRRDHKPIRGHTSALCYRLWLSARHYPSAGSLSQWQLVHLCPGFRKYWIGAPTIVCVVDCSWELNPCPWQIEAANWLCRLWISNYQAHGWLPFSGQLLARHASGCAGGDKYSSSYLSG